MSVSPSRQGEAPRRTLVTGAGGFIGRRLIAERLQAGDEVIGLDHFRSKTPESVWQWFHEFMPRDDSIGWQSRLQLLPTDIRSQSDVRDAMKSVHQVFHLAAAVATRSQALSESINVDGTRVLARSAADQPQPPTFVFASSLAAAGPRSRPSVEPDSCRPVSHYGRTKLAAELSLAEMAGSLPVTIARPPCVFGPGDRNLLALYQTVRYRWNVVLSKTDRYSYISVVDLIRGLVAACHRGRRLVPGEFAIDGTQQNVGLYYLTDDHPVTFVELADMIASTINRDRVRHMQIPTFIGYAIGGVGEIVLRTTGRKMFLNLDKIREGVGGSWICRGQRAADELSFATSASLAQRVAETTDYYHGAGWLPAETKTVT
ncbi:MAG: NAD(P)-dependent oxidoreductase [Planctomycetota bacterium]